MFLDLRFTSALRVASGCKATLAYRVHLVASLARSVPTARPVRHRCPPGIGLSDTRKSVRRVPALLGQSPANGTEAELARSADHNRKTGRNSPDRSGGSNPWGIAKATVDLAALYFMCKQNEGAA